MLFILPRMYRYTRECINTFFHVGRFSASKHSQIQTCHPKIILCRYHTTNNSYNSNPYAYILKHNTKFISKSQAIGFITYFQKNLPNCQYTYSHALCILNISSKSSRLKIFHKSFLANLGYTENWRCYKSPPSFKYFEKIDYVFKLDKALYGLQQVLRSWYERLLKFFIEKGYSRGV